MKLPRLFAVLLCALPITAAAHELWIEPLTYEVEVGDRVQAHFKNGQEFKGNTLSYFDRSAARFEVFADGAATVLTPRSGDSPALDIPAAADGLLSVIYETTPSLITYREWAKFQKFVAHKDFASAEADHAAAGWSQEKFRERYTRHAKALIAVGSGAGRDVAAGLRTEFTALTNPYAPSFDNNMKISLTLKGKPRADAQVEVFERAPDDSVTITLHRTDTAGHATIPVQPGHAYLFDAVVLAPAAEASPEVNAVVWETYWTALTFAVPK